MRKIPLIFMSIIIFAFSSPLYISANSNSEKGEDGEVYPDDSGNEYNEFSVKKGLDIYGEDISKLTEEELQYIPKAWREGKFESEHPEEEAEIPKARAFSVYPKVNNYIKNFKVPKVEYQHNSAFAKFPYRNGHGTVEGVVAHETANDNSTITQEIAYMSRNHNNAFVHAFVDHKRIIEIHPLDYGAWGAGRYANQRFVHVELVRVKNFDQFARSINNYADYLANILYDYRLGVTNAEKSGKGTLWSHKAVSIHLGGTNHVDPHGYFARYGYSWNEFVSLVKQKYNNIVKSKKANTSRLGKLKSSSARIYAEPTNTKKYSTAGSKYTNSVYYIKAESVVNGQTYYLISTKPSSKNGTIGWINKKDITTHSHKAVDNKKKVFYFKGKGAAYNRAWGGSKNLVYSSKDLSKIKGQEFVVNKTETVGNNTWYRGTFNGRTLWIHSSHLYEKANTSRLGKIKGAQIKIYKDIHDVRSSFLAGAEYTNQVFYIKQQIKLDNQTYYLISTRPSSTQGTIGWVESKDIKTYAHKAVDNKKKTFYFKGKGAAYNRAWGGSKNKIYSSSDLANFKYQRFDVYKTETVGKNTWYRGTFNGKTLWIHSSHLTTKSEEKTSRLGQINTANTDIYNFTNEETTTVKAGTEYTNHVFYIKKQMKMDGKTFYLISTRPNSNQGTIGWVESKDITTYAHKSVDSKKKTFYFKGKGAAYNRAWGGSKNRIYNSSDLANFKYQRFDVHKTETVGRNTWYRGTFDGKTLWIHSSHLTTKSEKSTSRLGQIKSMNAYIYNMIDKETSIFKAGKDYTNRVFYIKKQMKMDGKTFYLISTRPSSTQGTIGWVDSRDITTHTHRAVDNKKKSFYLKGKGVAYNRAWGGNKNVVFNSADLSKLKNTEFKVHKTEKVGNNIWYRGKLKGKTVWIHSSHLKK